MSVDTTDPDFKPPDEEHEMVPPLEHVIRTKWVLYPVNIDNK